MTRFLATVPLFVASASAANFMSHSRSQSQMELDVDPLETGTDMDQVHSEFKNSTDTGFYHQDKFRYVSCVNDEVLNSGDKFGNQFEYSENTPISAIRYDKVVNKVDRKPMTQEVCFKFCRKFDHIKFFGVQNGDNCYCSPWFANDRGASGGECDVPCPGNPGETCGGADKSSIFSMADAPAPAEHSEKWLKALSDIGARTKAMFEAARHCANNLVKHSKFVATVGGIKGDSNAVANSKEMLTSFQKYDGMVKAISPNANDAGDRLIAAVSKYETVFGAAAPSMTDVEAAHNELEAAHKNANVALKSASAVALACEPETGQSGMPFFSDVQLMESGDPVAEERPNAASTEFLASTSCSGEVIDVKYMVGVSADEEIQMCATACRNMVAPNPCFGFQSYSAGEAGGIGEIGAAPLPDMETVEVPDLPDDQQCVTTTSTTTTTTTTSTTTTAAVIVQGTTSTTTTTTTTATTTTATTTTTVEGVAGKAWKVNGVSGRWWGESVTRYETEKDAYDALNAAYKLGNFTMLGMGYKEHWKTKEGYYEVATKGGQSVWGRMDMYRFPASVEVLMAWGSYGVDRKTEALQVTVGADKPFFTVIVSMNKEPVRPLAIVGENSHGLSDFNDEVPEINGFFCSTHVTSRIDMGEAPIKETPFSFKYKRVGKWYTKEWAGVPPDDAGEKYKKNIWGYAWNKCMLQCKDEPTCWVSANNWETDTCQLFTKKALEGAKVGEKEWKDSPKPQKYRERDYAVSRCPIPEKYEFKEVGLVEKKATVSTAVAKTKTTGDDPTPKGSACMLFSSITKSSMYNEQDGDVATARCMAQKTEVAMIKKIEKEEIDASYGDDDTMTKVAGAIKRR